MRKAAQCTWRWGQNPVHIFN